MSAFLLFPISNKQKTTPHMLQNRGILQEKVIIAC